MIFKPMAKIRTFEQKLLMNEQQKKSLQFQVGTEGFFYWQAKKSNESFGSINIPEFYPAAQAGTEISGEHR